MKTKESSKRMSALILVIFFVAAATQAQPVRVEPEPRDRTPEVWKKYLGEQLAVSLASPITEIKVIALENTAFYASRHDTTLNLKPVIPALSKIYRKDPEERCRLLAVGGLHYIGDFESMLALREGLRFQRSKNIQWVTVAALVDHFGPEAFKKDKELHQLAASLVRYYKNRPLPIPVEQQVPEPAIAASQK